MVPGRTTQVSYHVRASMAGSAIAETDDALRVDVADGPP